MSVDYGTKEVPPLYKCKCGRTKCKLWRKSGEMLVSTLYCWFCMPEVEEEIDDMIPAILAQSGLAYIPPEGPGYKWWLDLPWQGQKPEVT